ncbi:MAG: hypothetical protein R6X06_10975 [Gammaproteobacteria bacterium]
METIDLGFGVARPIGSNINELIVHQGVEIDDAMVHQYHAYLNRQYPQPFGLLINKKHDYSYTFEAQQDLGTLANIRAIAILVHRRSSAIAAQSLQNIKRESAWNAKIFHDYTDALAWLESQLTA